MLRPAITVTVLVVQSAPAMSQRADENAVASAGDAFGSSVGNERIGIYAASDVRGFSPTQAGNIRIEGLSVTEHGGFTNRVTSGSFIRVGLAAQNYPFPAPTGIADYSLRTSGNEWALSTVLTIGPLQTTVLELDAQIPIVQNRLSLAAGISARFDEPFRGETGKIGAIGGVLDWKIREGLEVKSFYGRMESLRLQQGLIFSAGAYLPPKIRVRYFGLDWAESRISRHFFGSLGKASLARNWEVRAGIFRWNDNQKRSYVELFRNVRPDGSAQRSLIMEKDQSAISTSGELRSSFSFQETSRRHVIHIAMRGRQTRRNYGGGCTYDFGSAVIGVEADIPEQQCGFGAPTRDAVRQLSAGISYHGMWLDIGELNLGMQKTDYRKITRRPGLEEAAASDAPWLYNGTLSVRLTPKLTAYASYTVGLEENGSAPANAVNRSSAPPPLQTSQRDAGVRYEIARGINLLAGLFDVRKPYFNLDRDRIYRELGTVRHRGIELSLAVKPAEGLTLLAGAVLLDAEVFGVAVDRGIIGSKPVGTAGRTLRANIDYRLPFFNRLSVDMALINVSPRVASSSLYGELEKQLTVPERTTYDVGMRYRFRLIDIPATLRTQVTNLFDARGWDVSANSSFRFTSPRRVLMSVAADI